MSEKNIKDIYENLKEQGKMAFLDGATREQIEKFEYDKGIIFPSQYKEWLLLTDGGECFLPAGVQFYGVNHKPEININDEDRPSDEYIPIGALSTGDPILFKKNSEEIVIFNHEDNRIEDDERYGSFSAFLLDLKCLLGIED